MADNNNLAFQNINAMLDIIVRCGAALNQEVTGITGENKTKLNEAIDLAVTKLAYNIRNVKDV